MHRLLDRITCGFESPKVSASFSRNVYAQDGYVFWLGLGERPDALDGEIRYRLDVSIEFHRPLLVHRYRRHFVTFGDMDSFGWTGRAWDYDLRLRRPIRIDAHLWGH